MAMELGVMTTEQAVRWNRVLMDRRSVRTYNGAALERTALRALTELRPEALGATRVRTVLVEGSEAASAILTGLVGSYGRILGAPAAMLFIGQTRDVDHLAAVGYVGQQAVLEATALGLATCWVGGAFSREVASRFVDLNDGEMVVAVTPIGRAREGSGLRRLHDASIKAFSGSAKRKSLEEIVQGAIAAEWLKRALEAARWAPSSVNGQPWRFRVEPGVVTVGYEPGRHKGPYAGDPRELDCGIAMANFAVSARSQGIQGAWHLRGGNRNLATFRWQANTVQSSPSREKGFS